LPSSFPALSISCGKSVSELEQMVTKATGVVAQLQKLENTDEELLAKYSKVYFLNEHYIPDNLSPVPNKYNVSGNGLQVKQEVLGFLLDMISTMEQNNLSPRIVSGYRSYDYQQQLKARYKNQYGSVANTFSADQGFSEHQLGTAIDFSNKTNGGKLEFFEKSKEYAWLLEHAHEYGFVLSYPNNNSYYTFEPWHWRFVGKNLAKQLHSQGKYFYDLTQREINTHLIDIFDK
jgi:D-alanyl-D-alanine carboxypeptidase